MPKWPIAMGLVAACAAVTAASAANFGAAAGAKTVRVPLPAVGAGEIMTFTVTVKGTGGIKVKTTNDAALGNLGLVYAVGKPTKPAATSTWTVDVLIKRFTANTRRLGSAAVGTVEVAVETASVNAAVRLSGVKSGGCKNAQWADAIFEGGGPVNSGGVTYTLQNGRSESEQPSPPEEVFDNIVASIPDCTFKAEGDDPGNK